LHKNFQNKKQALLEFHKNYFCTFCK